VRAVLARAGASLPDVARFEITEAFASQVLACTDTLGLDALGADAARVCPSGGAIAVGHPWAASGAFLVLRLLAGLDGLPGGAGVSGLGLAACAVGGGQGVAMLFERVG
jgi:acetyl-CoA C-acetyltransferase